jgi:hypothetical protein
MAAAAAAAAGHPGLIQQQAALSGRHRFTPPTEGGASSGSRPDMTSTGAVDGPSFPVSLYSEMKFSCSWWWSLIRIGCLVLSWLMVVCNVVHLVSQFVLVGHVPT